MIRFCNEENELKNEKPAATVAAQAAEQAMRQQVIVNGQRVESATAEEGAKRGDQRAYTQQQQPAQLQHLQQQPQQQQQQQQQQQHPPQQQHQPQLLSQSQANDKLSDISRPKRNPYCSRCRNHGKSAQVKGHKRHCEYRDCQCEGCKLVECRQIVSAAQIRRRRYQKQDEECGRLIEISPPVLTQDPHSSPATLIAKTLRSTKQLSAALPVRQAQQMPMMSVQAPFALDATASSAPLSTGCPTTTWSSPETMPSARDRNSHHSANSILSDDTCAVRLSLMSRLNQHLQQQQLSSTPQLSEAQATLHASNVSSNQPASMLAANPATSTTKTTTSTSTSFNEALNLCNYFPNPILSAAFGHHPHLATAGHLMAPASYSSRGSLGAVTSLPTSGGVYVSSPQSGRLLAGSGGAVSQSSSSSSPLSVREQYSLVEEIHRTFGPLAVYAWLRSEHFDVAKVRALINMARVPFEEVRHAFL